MLDKGLDYRLWKLRKKLGRVAHRLIPFKGMVAYEMQVGPVVVQYHYESRNWRTTVGIGKLRTWYDSQWWK